MNDELNDLTFRQDLMEGDEVHRLSRLQMTLDSALHIFLKAGILIFAPLLVRSVSAWLKERS